MARTQNFNRIKLTTSDSQENHIILQEVSGKLYIDDNLVLTSVGAQEGTRSLFITDLPTEDPGSVGQIWNESGVLKVSENQTSTPAAAGFQNRWGASFDGSDDYLTTTELLQSGSAVFTSSTDNVSMSGWVKLDSFVGDATLFGFGRTNNGSLLNSGSLGGIATLSTNKFYMHINGSQKNIPGTFNTGQWYHIAFTHNSTSGAGIVYINGSQVHTYSHTGNGFHSNISAYIGVGRWYYALSDAKIDGIAIWNSVLSASDVTSIYNSGVPSDISSLSPVGHWRMGDDSNDSASANGNIATITDSSGNGNDATQGTASKQPTFSDLTGETIYI